MSVSEPTTPALTAPECVRGNETKSAFGLSIRTMLYQTQFESKLTKLINNDQLEWIQQATLETENAASLIQKNTGLSGEISLNIFEASFLDEYSGAMSLI